MLREAGYRSAATAKELVLADADNDVEFFFLRPRDIAVYVGSGHARRRHHRPRPAARLRAPRPRRSCTLGFAGSTFRFAAPARASPTSCNDLAGMRVATTYAGLVAALPAPSTASTAEVVRLDGAVETASRLGVADVIADVVETGTTLRKAGPGDLRRADPAQSEAVLVRPRGQPSRRRPSTSWSAGCRASWSPAAT